MSIFDSMLENVDIINRFYFLEGAKVSDLLVRSGSSQKNSSSSQNGLNPVKMVRIQSKWSRSGQNGPDLVKMVRIRSKWSGSGQNGPDPIKKIWIRTTALK